MTELQRDPRGALLPLILSAFIALYVVGLLSGAEPETALLRAGGAGLLLAALGRAGSTLLDWTPSPSEPGATGQLVDTAVGDEGQTPWEAAHAPTTADTDPSGRE
jgi:hypothetical protein